MDKVELALPVEEWSTLKSKYAPDVKQVLPDEFTRGTINIDTQTKGAITKRKGGVIYNPTPLAAAFKDQYEAIFSDGVRHTLAVQSGEVKYTSGDRIFNTVQNGSGFVAGANFEFELTRDRVYGGNATNDGIVYDRSTSYGGVAYTAPRVKTMGAQAPGSAPVAGAPTAGGAVPNGAHTYKVTYLYYDFQESNGSAASGAQTAGAGNNTIPLTSIPIGGYGVTARKIYRDDNDGNYVLVATLTNNTATTHSDTALAGTTPIPLDHDVPPVFGQIVLFLDRLFIAQVPGNPGTIYYSEAGFPDIFPGLNFVICNQKDPITALVVYQDKVIVFNRRSMGQILGRTSDQFRYSHIPGSVGCVDNRTIQTRTIDGVPVLVWLSDKGFYAYNGSSITYISEDIEDQVNLNIRQSSQTKNSHTDDTDADFQAGTASGGIDIDTTPGLITTPNPNRVYDDNTDWNEIDSSITNVVSEDDNNKISIPNLIQLPFSSGQFSGTQANGNNLELILATLLASETSTFTGTTIPPGANRSKYASKFIPTATGVLTTAGMGIDLAASINPAHEVWSHDSTNDRPLASLGSVGSYVVSAGTTYWLVINVSLSGHNQRVGSGFSGLSGNKSANFTGSVWFGSTLNLEAFYQIRSFGGAISGTWTSQIFDSETHKIDLITAIVKGTYPSGTSSQVRVEGSDDSLFTGGPQISQTLVSPSNNTAITLSNKRYWRITVSLFSNNSGVTPYVSSNNDSGYGFAAMLVLEPANTGTWISAGIDATVDVTDYNSLDIVRLQQIGGLAIDATAVVTVATSADNITYPDGFVTFGTEVTRRYMKIKVVFTRGRTLGSFISTISPSVTSLNLKWTIVANFVSESIDTAVAPPAGWDIFQASDTLNGGTLQYQMRSGASLIALAAATFFNVTPESFPSASVTPLQYTQWKVIITSTAGNVPTIDSVTVTWLISAASSVRAASIFVDRRYFTAVAALGSDTNNIVFEFDVNGRWRVHEGLNISTLAFFFNDPYYGSASAGTMYKFLEGFMDDQVTNIPIDIRSKAFDFSSKYGDKSSHYKTLHEVILNGAGTGATYTVEYSADNGNTFITIPHTSGAMSYASTNDGFRFSEIFRVSFAYGVIVSGKTIMIRITTSDAFDIEIHSIKIRAWIRKQE